MSIFISILQTQIKAILASGNKQTSLTKPVNPVPQEIGSFSMTWDRGIYYTSATAGIRPDYLQICAIF